MNLKLCPSCRTVRLLEDFPKHGRARDGVQHRCKLCVANSYYHRAARWRTENRQPRA
jgi:hypothetical protein